MDLPETPPAEQSVTANSSNLAEYTHVNDLYIHNTVVNLALNLTAQVYNFCSQVCFVQPLQKCGH